MMKYNKILFLLSLLLVMYSANLYGQTFKYRINKNYYDSLTNQHWTNAILYFNNETKKECLVYHPNKSPLIQIKENDSTIKTFTHIHIKGFILKNFINQIFVYKNISNNKHIDYYEPIELFIKGKISVYNREWVSTASSQYSNKKIYYYKRQILLEKNNKLIFLQNYKKDLLPLINNNKTLDFYKSNKPKNKMDLGGIINLINYYNNQYRK